jgi:hypothetical protein
MSSYPEAELLKYQSANTSIMESAMPAPRARRAFRMNSAVADSHARTVAALHAPEAPKEVNNFWTYFIGISTSRSESDSLRAHP